MKIPKVSQREWLFLGGGLLLGYLIIPKILHHSDDVTGCPPENVAMSQAGTPFCCGSPAVDGFCYDNP
jgi:hypothetical protein